MKLGNDKTVRDMSGSPETEIIVSVPRCSWVSDPVPYVQESHRPVVLTSRGRGVAVVQSLSDFEDQADERIFMKGVLEGMIDLEEGRELSLEDVKNRLKIK